VAVCCEHVHEHVGSIKNRKFLTRGETGSCSRRVLHYVVS